MYLALIGWPPRRGGRGQIEIDGYPFEDSNSPMHIPTSEPTSHVSSRGTENFLACLPVANVFFGIKHICEGVFSNGSYYNVAPDDKSKFKVLSVVGGVLELTLIGAWIVHGIATLYFYRTEPSKEELHLLYVKANKERQEREKRFEAAHPPQDEKHPIFIELPSGYGTAGAGTSTTLNFKLPSPEEFAKMPMGLIRDARPQDP